MTSDKTLAQKAAHDPEAFGELFDRYALRIFRYIYSRIHHRENAEDITSQVFHDAFKNINQYKPMSAFSAWLFTIARRRISDFFKKSQPIEYLSEEIPQNSDGILAEVILQEDILSLEKHLQALHDDELELLRLRFAGKLRYKEIALLVEKTPGAAKIAIYRLLKQLKASMEETDATK